ncbi:MAG TPA: hypothetical protein VNN73_05605 [Blastocatellia bacterium]|nr:hypothetical protein [Blastocatellia bacterium]
MEATSKNKWQVRVAAVVIFVLGFAAGALSLNLYRSYGSGSNHPPRQARFEKMLDRLNLSDEQRAQMEEIIRDTRSRLAALREKSKPEFMEIRRQSRERMQQVLTPEQWQQLEQMMRKMRERRPHTDD